MVWAFQLSTFFYASSQEVFGFFQLCDVVEMVIIHKNI